MKYALGNMLNGAGGLNADQLALDLQFAADKTLTARRGPTPVLTRGSTGTFVGSNGLIQTAAVNAARFDHDPVTLASRGLLIEDGRTNLLNGSQTFATSGGSQNNWVDTNITRDGTIHTSPDGTANALRITASAANGTVISSAAAGPAAARVFSIFLRRVAGTGDIQYTLNNGINWITQAITSSWVRYTFSETTSIHQVGIRIVTSANAIEIWGAQLEAGAFPTSYIPTTTSALARSADVCSITGTPFSNLWNASEGTMFVNSTRLVTGVNYNTILSANDGTNNNRVAIGNSGGPTAREFLVVRLGAVEYSRSSNISADNRRMALAYSQTSTNSSDNASLGTDDTSSLIPSVNQLLIGTGQVIPAIRYYKKRLPNAKLITLTT